MDNKTELFQCPCGHEYQVGKPEDIKKCEHCGEPCCEECTHTCDDPSHLTNDEGCERCMIFNKRLRMRFCNEDCYYNVVDPFGYLRQAEGNAEKMLAACLEVSILIGNVHNALCMLKSDSLTFVDTITTVLGQLSEAKSLLLSSQEQYLRKETDNESR